MTAALLDRALSIGAHPRDTADERFRKRLLVGVALIILPVAFVWGCLYWAIGEHEVALTPWAYLTGSAISLAVFARTRNFPFLRTAQQLLILVAPALGTVMLGGLDESSSVILWSLFAPLGAVAFDRPGRAWPWFAAFVATIVLALALSEVVRPNGADLPEAFVRTFDVLNIVVVSLIAMLLLVTFARGRDTAQARVETLLLNVLPAEVALRLQSDPNSIADHFDDASILFADVVDFTPLSSRLDAREVVALLDRLFTRFDELVDRHDVEKIKTIGDCYMAAAGVPSPRADHAHALAALALEMHECAKNCLPDGAERDLRLRIGISSGPVVAGVIGRRRFLYDLWGDTVNMASRMESHGTPGSIQITRSTWELLREDFVVEPLGLVDVKGKGAVETWRLVGPVDGSSIPSAGPPPLRLQDLKAP
jgi:adenylate cyclase